MNIYDENGYVNIPEILRWGYPFVIIYGGRGTGKTYGALLYALEKNEQFILMRRLKEHADLIANPEFSPFKSVCADHPEFKITSKPIGKVGGIFDYQLDGDGKMILAERPRGIICALSGIAKLRGFDASGVRLMIFDEFIPEAHERLMRSEGEAILNAFETVNRNRELKGEKPVQFLALANSSRIDNPLFETLGLVNVAQQMADGKRPSVYANRDRGILLISLDASPISKAKRKTALYKLTAGSDFEKMAIDNKFTGVSFENVRPVDLTQYKPVVTVGEITIYRHKSENKYHVSFHRSGSVPEYKMDETDVKRFTVAYASLWFKYIDKNNFTFESAAALVLFEKLYM